MQLFDLEGPAFLGLWCVGWLVVIAGVLVMRRMAARAAGVAHDEIPPSSVGYLIGGVRRAVESAIAGLHHRGLVTIEGRWVDPVTPAPFVEREHAYRGTVVPPGELAPAERYVLDRIPARARSLVSAPELDAHLQRELEMAGLLVRDRGAKRWLLWLFPLVWLVTGGIKVCIGVARDRPVGFLVVLIALATFACWRWLDVPRRTAAGDRVVATTRASHLALEDTARWAPQQLDPGEMTLAYALFGAPIAHALVVHAVLPESLPATSVASNASSGCAGGASCGSGGGGGGCGSGCGGCGGCGGCS
jgi:uncharacterized protein (TIGR04222 family)